jgi:hypothetical protein
MSRRKPIITNRNQAYFAELETRGLQEGIYASCENLSNCPRVPSWLSLLSMNADEFMQSFPPGFVESKKLLSWPLSGNP